MMVRGEGPIGLLDSGVGGLTVAREIIRFMPAEEIVYYGDTLHLPYGPKKKEEVREYVFRIMDFLIKEKKARIVVLACNTASAFTLDEAADNYSVPVFGTLIGASKRAVQVTANGKIGVIGTEGTVKSRAFQDKIKEIDQEIEVYAQACPRFVELVEDGSLHGRVVEETARKYLQGLKEAGIDTLILGCTHFPYLTPVIQQEVGEGVALINPGTEVAREVKERLLPEDTVSINREFFTGSAGAEIKKQEFLVSDLSRISKTFLKEGSNYLQLPSLEFKEKNIFKAD